MIHCALTLIHRCYFSKCVLTAVNVDWGCYNEVNVNLWGLYVGCSVKEALVCEAFSPVVLSCKAKHMFEDTLHHPYILLVFAENIFSTLVSLVFSVFKRCIVKFK